MQLAGRCIFCVICLHSGVVLQTSRQRHDASSNSSTSSSCCYKILLLSFIFCLFVSFCFESQNESKHLT
ncbi:hypothetical protein LDENG_00108470 [Lucifuga dentata]|nr:hypothetical protein LDENG_00108470 [Lucifuga dentata]